MNEIIGTLCASGYPDKLAHQDVMQGMYPLVQIKESDIYIYMSDKTYAVRRLTPTECERLQGFFDGWTNIGDWVDSKGKKHKGEADSPRYKALGNSVAIPFWHWLFGNITEELGADEQHTLGSLFSGIGGLDIAWELNNGIGTSLWASEIEEFPIAVLKQHFGDEDAGIEGDLWKYLEPFANRDKCVLVFGS